MYFKISNQLIKFAIICEEHIQKRTMCIVLKNNTIQTAVFTFKGSQDSDKNPNLCMFGPQLHDILLLNQTTDFWIFYVLS